MYQALYRKYRSVDFSDVVGQRAVTETLRKQVAEGRFSHAYLFTGTRGTGKTSCARILAKAVNCEHPIDGNPCNHCASCRGIDSGSVVDVLEIDAASNNGVDHIRALREEAIYAPAEVRYRVYIIDEVHMLSTSAFNALLKILEEPPAHLLFILATTELQKVPATILSRCQRFSFRRLQAEDIEGRLKYIAHNEQITLTDGAAKLLSRLADGGMRDAVSLLDQCAGTADVLDEAAVYSALGLAGQKQSAAILEAAARHDNAAALKLLADLYSAGKDLAALLSELTGLTRDLLVYQSVPNGASLMTGPCSEDEIKRLSKLFTPSELLRLTTLLQQTASGFTRSANRRIDAELCLLRMCDPSLTLDAEALDARLSRLETQVATGVVVAAPQHPAEERPPWDEDAPPGPWDDEPPPDPQGFDEPMPAKVTAPPPGTGFWPDLIAAVKPALPPMVRGYFAVSDNSPVSGSLSGDVLTLSCTSEFVQKMVDKPNIKELIAQKAQQLLGSPVRVRFGGGSSQKEDHFAQLLADAGNLKNVTIR